MKISVITPSFNHAHYIGRTIRSVLDQPAGRPDCAFEVEHIVIDGGSNDGTIDILRSLGPKIRWVSEPDRGQADALNKGLAMAGGDVIGWLNSDDVYEPGALAAVADVFSAEPQTIWAYGRVKIIDAQDREIRQWITAYKNRRMRQYNFSSHLAENWISQMGVFWRATAGRQVGPFRTDLHWTMDYDYWLRLGKCWPGRFIDRCLAAFRWHPASKSGSGFTGQFREELSVAAAHADGRFAGAMLRHRFNYAKIVTAYTMMRVVRQIFYGSSRKTDD
ncbi:MAG: glycosyltransferase [Planctomycetes bacterium]|nr:glycosyltransferase [Planctomycetota bacterium]